jgi:catechol 2,3-dioxygenase-like lactoylglutathione lyase family enzyme
MIKVDDIAFVRFSAPDLDKMEAFLTDFGLARAHRDAKTLYMRGLDADPYFHVTQLGEPGFIGFAFEAKSEADLAQLAKGEDARIESLDGPGGGKVVRLADPNGFEIEVVAARTPAAKLEMPASDLTNDARTQPRRNKVKRLDLKGAHVKRLGHCVINVKDFRQSEAWYKQRFGLITSDEIYLGSEENAFGAFLRCDRGELPADHHTLFMVGTGAPKFNHAAFEVVDYDDLMAGHHLLKSKGYAHEWGVGRHVLGSQVFDYWRDPWGHAVEHWTDGDLLTASWGSRKAPLDDLVGVQWGTPAPPTMA